MKIKKVKTSTLVIGLMVELIFSIFMGVIAVSIGLGSIFPQLNLIAGPFLCPNQEMSYTQNVTEIGSDTYWSAAWFCVDEGTGPGTELDPDTVNAYAGSFYGVLIFIALLGLTYLYWNSSIGPAKNDGLRLW